MATTTSADSNPPPFVPLPGDDDQQSIFYHTIASMVRTGHHSKFPNSVTAVESLTVGRVYSDTTLDKENVKESKTTRVKSLLGTANPLKLPKNPYAERQEPQYEAFQASNFVHIKDTCKG